MAGKPRNDNWGGGRGGAGRPKNKLTTCQVKNMLDTAATYAKKHGITVDELLLECMYSETAHIQYRLQAIRLFKDKTMAHITEGGDTDRDLGPATYLPEEKPDFAKVVDIHAVETT